MKTLHVTESVKGGIATYLDSIVPAQHARHGTEGLAFAVTPDGAASLRAVPARSCHPVAPARGSLLAFLAYVRDVARVIRDLQPEVIHAHSTFAGVVVRILRLLGWHRAGVIYCPHGWSFDRHDGRLRALGYRVLERALAGLADRIVCISRHDYWQARRLGIPRHRLALACNGLPPAPAPQAADTAPGPGPTLRLAFVGRLDRQKGVDVLLAALQRLDRPWHLVCAGAPVLDDADPGEATTAARAPPGTITYTGWLEAAEVSAILARCDAVVVPSRWEGFGLVAVEAMRQGRAVIASEVGGLGEIVVEGETGALVPPDDPAALAACLNGLDLAALPAWGTAGARRYRAFYTDRQLAARLAEIDAMVRAGTPAGARP